MTPGERQRQVGIGGGVLVATGVARTLFDPTWLERHSTPFGCVVACVLVLPFVLGWSAWHGRKLRNSMIKRRWFVWLGLAAVLELGFTAVAVFGSLSSHTAIVLCLATQAAFWRSWYELAGASDDDWDRSEAVRTA